MAKEIERKYLVSGESYKAMATAKHRIVQGYLSTNPDATVRVRIYDHTAFITVKSRNSGAVRSEWEYAIPTADAEEMISECGLKCIEKTRYIVPFEDKVWEVDEFHGALAPLVLAEVELSSADESLAKPDFAGREVTSEPEYYNSVLISRV